MNVARDATCGERSKFIRAHPSGRGAARGGCPGGGGQAARGYKRGRPWPRLAHSQLSPLSRGVGSLPAAELRLRLHHAPARIAAALSLSHSSCAFRRPHDRPNWNFLQFLVNFAVRCRCSAPRDWADWRSAVAVLVGVWVCDWRGGEGFFVGCRVIGNLVYWLDVFGGGSRGAGLAVVVGGWGTMAGWSFGLQLLVVRVLAIDHRSWNIIPVCREVQHGASILGSFGVGFECSGIQFLHGVSFRGLGNWVHLGAV